MRRFFINDSISERTEDGSIVLRGSDVNHILNVLRFRIGDNLIFCDSDGTEFVCELSDAGSDFVKCSVIECKSNSTEPYANVILIQGIAKGDKNELIIQKAVELGVCEIRMCSTDRTVVRFGSEKDEIKKNERWNKISEEASKQSGRGIIPAVAGPLKFKEAISVSDDYLRIIAYENETDTSLKDVLSEAHSQGVRNIAFIVGPEGGISPSEYSLAVESGYRSVSLGKRILRTETAGLALLSSVRYEYED